MGLLSGCATTTKTLATPAAPVPAWVDSLPRTHGALCALGSSGPTFYQQDCVKNAADNGRGHLAESITVSIKSITMDISDGTRGYFSRDVFVQGSQSVSNAVLQGAEINAQWMDFGGQRGPHKGCFVMICIDKTKPINSLVQQIEKQLPPKTVAKVRADAAKAFEELEKAEQHN